MLENETDMPLFHVEMSGADAVEMDVAGIRPIETRDDAQERGLARSGRTEEREQFSAFDLEAHVAQSDESAKALRYTCYVDIHRLLRSSFRSKAVFKTSVTRASIASSDATAKAAAD